MPNAIRDLEERRKSYEGHSGERKDEESARQITKGYQAMTHERLEQNSIVRVLLVVVHAESTLGAAFRARGALLASLCTRFARNE